MNQQFAFRMQSQETEQKRATQPNFITRTREQQRNNTNTNSSVSTMFQRSTQLQVNEYEGGNMSSLHAKLHQEADKIRKWKIQTELDIKEKSKRLIAASTQIETMKKSLLELQLDNERLSSKMQEEIDNREEIMQKMSSTRTLCDILKSSATKLEERILHCETEKTELKYTGREHSQHLEELSNKFENLRLSSESSKNMLVEQVEKERQEYFEKNKLLTSQYEGKLAMVGILETDLEERNKAVSELQGLLQEKTTDLESLNKSLVDLEQKSKALEDNVNCKEKEFKEAALRILTIQDEKHQLEVKLKKCESDFHCLEEAKEAMHQKMIETCTEYEKSLRSAQGNIHTLETTLEKEKYKLESCQTELQTSTSHIEKLKNTSDILTIEKTELKMNLDLQSFELTNLKTEVAEKRDEIKSLDKEMNDISNRLDRETMCRKQLQNVEKELQSELHCLQLEKDNHFQTVLKLQTALESTQNEVNNIISKESEQMESLHADIKSKDKELEVVRIQMKKLGDKNDELKDVNSRQESHISKKDVKILELEKDLQIQQSSIEECKEALTHMEDEVEELRKNYKEEQNKTEDLTSQLKDRHIESKEHGKSLASQQKKFAAQTKQNKDLEKEVKSLKAELSKEVKKNGDREKMIEVMKEEIETLKQNIEDVDENRCQYEQDMKALRDECVQDKKASEEAMTKAKEMQELAKKEKDNAKAVTECQLTEMMVMLDTYKQSSEKIIAEKEVEARSLKTKLEALEAKISNDSNDLKDENIRLSSSVTAISKEKEELCMKLMETADENQYLKRKIEELEIQKNSGGQSQCNDFNKTPKLPLDSHLPQEIQKNSGGQSQCNDFNKTPKLPLDSHLPQSKASQQVTPVTPQKQISWTPKTPKNSTAAIKDGQNGLITPQRSILRASSSTSKRRKVAFISDDQELPSSSENLMELEVDIESRNHPDKCHTPIQQPSTPRVLSLSSPTASRMTPKRSSRIPLNKPLQTSTPMMKITETPTVSVTDRQTDAVPKIVKHESRKTPNIRNVLPKKTSKFFTTSPKDKAMSRTRIKDKAKVDGGRRFSWFDLDSVYGFGPED